MSNRDETTECEHHLSAVMRDVLPQTRANVFRVQTDFWGRIDLASCELDELRDAFEAVEFDEVVFDHDGELDEALLSLAALCLGLAVLRRAAPGDGVS